MCTHINITHVIKIVYIHQKSQTLNKNKSAFRLYFHKNNISVKIKTKKMDAAAGAGLDKLSPQQKEELMKTVQTQVALANMQELLTVSKSDPS